jgi:hypothetical protein
MDEDLDQQFSVVGVELLESQPDIESDVCNTVRDRRIGHHEPVERVVLVGRPAKKFPLDLLAQFPSEDLPHCIERGVAHRIPVRYVIDNRDDQLFPGLLGTQPMFSAVRHEGGSNHAPAGLQSWR